MDAYAELATDEPNILPPRMVTIPADELAELAELDGDYGDGDILYVGRSLDANHNLAECDCEIAHVQYMIVRADGVASNVYVSGTLGEALFGPPEVWDDARPVDPTDWPSV
jgi:hypothetical protein